jgi:hypothetical protein
MKETKPANWLLFGDTSKSHLDGMERLDAAPQANPFAKAEREQR